MSGHLATRIEKPDYFSISHLKMGRGKRKAYVIGFDSESHSCGLLDDAMQKVGKRHPRCGENGLPFLFQFGHPDGHVDLVDVNLPTKEKPHTALGMFLEYLKGCTRERGVEYVVVGYNLSYEFTQLFRNLPDDVKCEDRFWLIDEDGEWKLDVLNSKRFTFTIEWTRRHVRVKFIDGMAFVQGGLDAAGTVLGIGRKVEKPPYFDRANAHDDAMRAYAEQDAVITQRLGEWIIEQHQRNDVRTTMSGPHFASSVFKRVYLESEIPIVDGELEQAGLEAYHGGKNGFYLNEPATLRNVWHVDIRSAYPEAMRQLPDPEQSSWLYHETYREGLHAVWRIEGRYKRCRYRGLMGHEDWPTSGRIKTTVTGYELDEALRRGEIELTSCHGWAMMGPEDSGGLVRYVDEHYHAKRYATNGPAKLYAKLMLNWLYGKFFQKVANGAVGSVELGTEKLITTDPNEPYDYRAGGLYHPPIAALITGYVRAKIHRMEHDYQSIMTSTDGIFSRRRPDKALLGHELGQLSAERGTLRIWRERLYIFDPDDGSGQVYALHGFQGSVNDLAKVPLKAGLRWRYVAQRMVTLRMSTKALGGTRYAPGEFVVEKREVNMPGSARGP